MYHRRTIARIPSRHELEQRQAEYRRQATLFSHVFAWLSAVVGLFALFVFLTGYRASFLLPDVPRPGVGPGFSESATAAIGALWFGGWIALIALLLLLPALLYSKRRLHTLVFALPAVLCIVLIATHPRWLLAALSYGL